MMLKLPVSLFRKHYNRHLLDQTNFYPNGREIVEHFSSKKNAISCPINLSRSSKKFLGHLNFLNPFDSILGGDSLNANKNLDPKGLQFLMNKLNCPAKKVLMVGDGAIDIETGKRAGVLTCGVTYGFGDPNFSSRFQA